MRTLLPLLTPFLFAISVDAQQYEFVDRSGNVTATAEALTGRLVVHESSGRRIYFSREPRYDSMDGQRLGFYSSQSNRVIRLPRSGHGSLQVADLDDVSPRFRTVHRTVRPINSIAPGGFGNLSRAAASLPNFYPQSTVGYVSPYDHHGLRSVSRVSPYAIGYRQPQSVMLDSQTTANPPLSNVTVELTNSGPRELRVTIDDLDQPAHSRRIKIQPGQVVAVSFRRDAGAQLTQTFRIITPLGDSITKEIATPIAPKVLYQITAHEWAMQSIAIDRTGKSPSVIEDINEQGRGIGHFAIPPGNQLQPARIDVYAVARARGNAGAIAPIVAPKSRTRGNASSLEQTIIEAQQNAIKQRNR